MSDSSPAMLNVFMSERLLVREMGKMWRSMAVRERWGVSRFSRG